MSVKDVVRRMTKRAGFVVHRWPTNRSDRAARIVAGRRWITWPPCAGGDPGNTGAFVTAESEPFPLDLQAAAATLDELFAGRVEPAGRALLMLDSGGHEVEALQSASLLDRVEVVVSEVRFFDVNRAGRPLFGDVMACLDGRGFALFDFASLDARPRDQRLRIGDAIVIRRGGQLAGDVGWG